MRSFHDWDEGRAYLEAELKKGEDGDPRFELIDRDTGERRCTVSIPNRDLRYDDLDEMGFEVIGKWLARQGYKIVDRTCVCGCDKMTWTGHRRPGDVE